MQQKCTFSLITQDKSEFVVPDAFVDQSVMLSDYAKTQLQNNGGGAEEQHAKFEMTNDMPMTSKVHLDLIIDFLRIYQKETLNKKEGNSEMNGEMRSDSDEANLGEAQVEPSMPKWAFELFSSQPKDVLFLTMNAANYFGIGPFVSHSTAFVCYQILQMKPGEVAKYLNTDIQ